MNVTHAIRWLLAIWLFTGAAPDSLAQTFVFTDINIPGATTTNAWGINDANRIVGWYEDGGFIQHGFIYDGDYSSIDVPTANFTAAYGINNEGTIVGMTSLSSGISGFVYDGSTYTTLVVPDASFTTAHDVNDAGTVVGSFMDNTGNHGFVYDGTNYTTLDYPGAVSTTAYGINNGGKVVGWYDDGSAGHGFIYDGSYTALDVPSIPGRSVRTTSVYGISDAGVVVGSYQDTNFLTHGFLFDGMEFATIEPPGTGLGDVTYNEVTGINNDDDLSGWYTDVGGSHGYVRSAPTFNDVPSDHWAFSFIERLANSGITAGCGNGNYCSTAPVTRAQMAVFLERGMNGSDFVPPAATGNVFLDVGAGDFAASFIEQLFLDGITSGCGGNNYCPTDAVTRAQMAVFLLRAKFGAGHIPPPATGVFDDVDLAHFAVAWIEQLAAEGITSGCGGGNYCPSESVTRAQMAVFLVRTFEL